MLFDSTVRRELARSFGVTLVVILTIVLTMMLISTLGKAAGGFVAPQDVVLLMGYSALGHLPTILSLSLFIAVVVTLGRMYRDSEMTVWFSAGVALNRFVRPVLRMAWPVLLAVVVLELVVWPWSNQNSQQLRERYEKRSDLSRVAPGQFQTSRDGSRVFFIERDSDDGRTGRNVFILTTTPSSEAVTSSRQGRIELVNDTRFLVLDRGQRNESSITSGEKSLARFDNYRVLADQQLLRAAEQQPPKALSTADLLASPSPRNRGELAWRLGIIFGGINLALLGIGLSASNPRRPNNWNLLFAVLCFLVYFNLIGLTQAWVSSGRVEMLSALLAIHGGTFALGTLLIWWRVHGVEMASMRRVIRRAA
jgi:lipopolysaccharide export system permease protein